MKRLLIPIAVLAILLVGASPLKAATTPAHLATAVASRSSEVTHLAVTGTECARAQKIAHTTAACVETISTHQTVHLGMQAAGTVRTGVSWLDITGPFNLWEVWAVSNYWYDGTHVYELYEDCADHGSFGVGVEIVSCKAVNNGGAYLGYMLPGVVWKVSFGPFTQQDVARWRVYTNGTYCCAYGTHG